MDPLVSALSGSQNLISQGLRTLELCVDNLQPDFLYDHIQPVRAELMQVSPERERGNVSIVHDTQSTDSHHLQIFFAQTTDFAMRMTLHRLNVDKLSHNLDAE